MEGGSVAAFVPTRNEEEIIQESIGALVAQGTSVHRIVVVDDGSTDQTPSLLKALALEHKTVRAVFAPGPKPGDCGKPSALLHAFQDERPDTEWLLFLDADVVLQPQAIDRLLSLAREHNADLVSLLPELELKSPIEQLVMPTVGTVIVSRYPPHRVNDPKDPLAFANGQLLLVRRSQYEAAGGHQAVLKEVLEDVRFAERVKKNGGRLLVLDGRDLARTRMYKNWNELKEGWSKNFFLLMGSAPRSACTALFVLLMGWSPVVALFGKWPLSLYSYGGILIIQLAIRRRSTGKLFWALLAPIGASLAAYLLLRSTFLHLMRKNVLWKGRSYPGGKPRA